MNHIHEVALVNYSIHLWQMEYTICWKWLSWMVSGRYYYYLSVHTVIHSWLQVALCPICRRAPNHLQPYTLISVFGLYVALEVFAIRIHDITYSGKLILWVKWQFWLLHFGASLVNFLAQWYNPSQTTDEYSSMGLTYVIYIWFRARPENTNFSFLMIPIIREALVKMESMWSFHFMFSLSVKPICLWWGTNLIFTSSKIKWG